MASFLHVDYVRNAVENRFSNRLPAQITTEEYQRLVFGAARVNFVVGGGGDISLTEPQWLFVSFRAVVSGDPELVDASRNAGKSHRSSLPRGSLLHRRRSHGPSSPKGPRFQRLPLLRHQTVFVTGDGAFGLLRRAADPRWSRVVTE